MSTSRLAGRAAALTALTFGGLAMTAVSAPMALADPPGNNGTVKIAAEDDLDLIPDNEPHPGCAFTVQWYNFDKGDDIISKVTFELQAPTNDPEHSMTVNGPAEVFVGEDEADGAGNDFDGEQVYTLDFTGTPAAQGFHVKLTVNTPGSKGADVKHKVFWVEGCEDEETPEETPTPTPTETPTETPAPEVTGIPEPAPSVLGTETHTEAAPIPTLIDAGAAGAESESGSNAVGVALLAGGGALGAAAVALSRAPRGRRQI
ncbi:MAG TPA: hypothetical protein VFK41_13560 [Nocardioidaceae bacterium]|nr:hypothetical protein [Nocardioidaceae bacterium]